jgi:hypothetical protein
MRLQLESVVLFVHDIHVATWPDDDPERLLSSTADGRWAVQSSHVGWLLERAAR